MKILTLLFLMSFSVFGEDFAKAPYIGFASLGATSGIWHRDWKKNLIKPLIKFYSSGELKGAPKFILNKALMSHQEFIKEQERLNQVKIYSPSVDDIYLVVKQESEIAVRVGENFWINKKDVYYFSITGEKFRKSFNAVKIPPKGFYKSPNGETFQPDITDEMKKNGDPSVVKFINSQTIDGVIWLQFTSYYKSIREDEYQGASWSAWIPAFDSKGEPLFYSIY